MQKSKAFTPADLVQYVPNAVVTKSILEKPRGNISILSFDKGEGLIEKITPFDTFAQIIEGTADVVISGERNQLLTGQYIVIPAHSPYLVSSDQRFKMMVTVIKSGYQV
ncbi:MAG: cupin domain-containing protein [Saprospiraceae bacterium]|nr:cupin domain-containing protein [Saprospiraceae bacterium]